MARTTSFIMPKFAAKTWMNMSTLVGGKCTRPRAPRLARISLMNVMLTR